MQPEPIDNIKAKLGRTATFAWLVGGALLLVCDGGLRSLLTLKAIGFLVVGMFVAAVAVGLLAYKLFLRLAVRASLSVPVTEARDAVVRSYRQTQIVACVAGLVFVLWVYASFFWV